MGSEMCIRDSYHARLLPTPKEVHNRLRYVLLNARRHAAAAEAKLSTTVRCDPASSGPWFDGWKRRSVGTGRAESAATPDPPPVARAKTWLLTVGWRRHGLIDPTDVPG